MRSRWAQSCCIFMKFRDQKCKVDMRLVQSLRTEREREAIDVLLFLISSSFFIQFFILYMFEPWCREEV